MKYLLRCVLKKKKKIQDFSITVQTDSDDEKYVSMHLLI